jgi:beta-N-acetylhexosaminidase
MVMVSSAYYAKIDPDHRAAFSTEVIGSMLRRDLNFDGVVISDDLAAAAMSDLAPGTRALRFVRAGGDLLIVGDRRRPTPWPTRSSRRRGTTRAWPAGSPRAPPAWSR